MQYTKHEHRFAGRQIMNQLNQFIDKCIIDEYATKDQEGYTLDVDSIPEHDKALFLEKIMENDTTLRDIVLFHMQRMINDRIPECEVNDRFENGYQLNHRSNGDTYLTRKAI